MTARRLLGALARGAARKPLAVVAIALALGAAGLGLGLQLRPSAAADTFVGRSSSSFQATEGFYRHFGGEPIDVVVQGSLKRLLLSENIEKLVGLEGCLSGKVPKSALSQEGGAGGPCGQIDKLAAVKAVIGPGTFVSEAAADIDAELQQREQTAQAEARKAEEVVRKRALAAGRSRAEATALGRKAREANLLGFAGEVSAIAVKYGISGLPSIEDHSFVSSLVFESSAKTPFTPKRRFAYLFPSRDAALISVRLRGGVDEARAREAIAAIEKAVAMPQWRLRGGSYLVTGEPVIVAQLSASITHSVLLLLIAVALLMALVLSLLFRGRPRLLPLGIASLASAVTFGGLELSGSGLSIGEVAVLPVLIGLSVDYAIQLHSRVQESLDGDRLTAKAAVMKAAMSSGPAIAAAAAASIGALLMLELSPVPTVRGFATLVTIGLAIALLFAVTIGSAAIVLRAARDGSDEAEGSEGEGSGGEGSQVRGAEGGRFERRSRADAPRRSPRLPIGPLAASWRGAEELARTNPLTRLFQRAVMRGTSRRPLVTLSIAVLLAAAGFAFIGRLPVQTDIAKLVPQDMPSLRDLSTLERLSGVGGEIDLVVRSDRKVSKPTTIEWMAAYEQEVLRRFGYVNGRRCGTAKLCPAFSLPDLFHLGGSQLALAAGETGGSGGSKLTSADVNGLLAAIPAYFSEEVITPDRHYASLAFGVRLMPLSEQERMIESMQSQLKPPPGVHAALVGLPVLAAQASAAVASPARRVLELLAGLAAVALVLLIAFKGDLRRALVPLVPVSLASGWSALIAFSLKVPLNPMSVALGALTIAVCTEFSVLFSERYREELTRLRSAREANPRQALDQRQALDPSEASDPGHAHDQRQALSVTLHSAGAAIAASGLTAIAGFGVLALSDIAMLREFGALTLIDLAVSLLGVMLLLPGVLCLAYRDGLRPLPRARLRARAALNRGASETP